MKRKFSILYSWFIRTVTFFLPDIPIIMRFRGFLYSLFMKQCGPNLQVAASVILNSLTGLSFGKHIYLAPNTVVMGTDITIGDEVMVGPNSSIIGGNHSFVNQSYRFGKSIPGPVTISPGCWIGAGCTILAGSFLPEQSVLGAGSVLNKIHETPKSLYAGTPARFVKSI